MLVPDVAFPPSDWDGANVIGGVPELTPSKFPPIEGLTVKPHGPVIPVGSLVVAMTRKFTGPLTLADDIFGSCGFQSSGTIIMVALPEFGGVLPVYTQ